MCRRTCEREVRCHDLVGVVVRVYREWADGPGSFDRKSYGLFRGMEMIRRKRCHTRFDTTGELS